MQHHKPGESCCMNAIAMQPLPPEVAHLGNFEVRVARHLRAAVEDWDEVCSALGAWEAEHLTATEPGPARGPHRAWVERLLSWGQLMQRLTEHPGCSDQTVVARVQARLRHLEDKLALWHGDMTLEDEERIVRSAFA